MSDRIELLAILLTGLLPQFRRERGECCGMPPANDNPLSQPEDETEVTTERPTSRLLRLLGRLSEHPPAF